MGIGSFLGGVGSGAMDAYVFKNRMDKLGAKKPEKAAPIEDKSTYMTPDPVEDTDRFANAVSEGTQALANGGLVGTVMDRCYGKQYR